METRTMQAGSATAAAAAVAADLPALDRDLCGEIWAGGKAVAMLETLCIDYGGRFAGSANYRGAAEYVSRAWAASGVQDVHLEEFPIVGWERGSATLAMIAPVQRAFPCISLPPAPACDLEAEALDLGFGIEPDIAAAGEAIKGKIVLVRSGAPPGMRAPHRLEKYIRAREAGAAGFLFADGEPGMLAPTGSLPSDPLDSLASLERAVPGAGIPYEAGVELGRWLARGTVRLRLRLESKLRHDVSWNVAGELPGRDPDAPLTLVGGHLDGHDIGQAAIDNASGIVAVSEAARALAAHATNLGGTVRFLAFGAEEFGMWGSYAYAAAHRDELDRVRFFYNLDCVGTPGQLGLLLQNCAELAPYFQKLGEETGAGFAVNEMLVPFSDQFPFTLEGVPSAFIATHGGGGGRGWGHTSADTLDKVDVRAIRDTAATVARLVARSAADVGWPGRRRTPDETRDALKAQGVEAQLRLLGAWPW